MIVFNHSFGPDVSFRDAFFARDGGHASLIHRKFYDYFTDRKVEVRLARSTSPIDPTLDYAFYLDTSWRHFPLDEWIRRMPKHKRVLLMFEPPNVNPSLWYIPRIRDQFGTVFCWSLPFCRKYEYAHYPIFPWADPMDCQKPVYRTREKLCCAISSNRWSYMPQSTYGFRRRVYAEAERLYGHDFDLYGDGWSRPRVWYTRWTHRTPESYVGRIAPDIECKLAILRSYKFSIVIENNLTTPGYVDSKLVDCLCARTVPIYWGVRGWNAFVHPECVVDGREFRTPEHALKAAADMKDDAYREKQRVIERWVHSTEAKWYSWDNVFGIIDRRLYAERKTEL